jgi:hypothetical protein
MDLSSLHRVGDASPFPVGPGKRWDCYTTVRTGRISLVLMAPNIQHDMALEFVTAPILKVGYYQSLSLQAVALSVLNGGGEGLGRDEWVLACPLNDDPGTLAYWASTNQGSFEQPRLDVVLVDSASATIKAARSIVVPNELIETAMLYIVSHGDYFVAKDSANQFMALGPDVVWETSMRWNIDDADTVTAPMYSRPQREPLARAVLQPLRQPVQPPAAGFFSRLLGGRR